MGGMTTSAVEPHSSAPAASDVLLHSTSMPSEIPFIECSGTHRQMGRQQGRAFSRMVRDGVGVFTTSEAFEQERPAWLPRAAYVWLAGLKSRRTLETDLRNHVPRQLERLEGLAEGSGLGLGNLYLLHAAELFFAKVDVAPGACSAIAVSGDRAAEGEPLLIKNFDYPELACPLLSARLSRPDGGCASVELGAVSLTGNHDGINEHGLAIAYNYGYGTDPIRTSVPLTFLVQEALESCHSTAEAAEFLTSAARGGSGILTLADSEGDIRVLELSPGNAAQRTPTRGLLVATNHYEAPDMLSVDIPHQARYGDGAVESLRGIRIHQSSEQRLSRAQTLLEDRSVIGPDILKSVVSDHGDEGVPQDDVLCRKGAYYETLCSVLFRPKRREMEVVWGPPCSRPWQTLSL